MFVEGKISVGLDVVDGRVDSVSIESIRPWHLPQLMCGRTAQDAVHTVALLYRICAEAQSLASVQAVESAKGIVADKEKQWVRRRLLNMEIIREHAWRILLDWPVLLGGQPHRQAMAEIMALAGEWKRLLDPDQQAFQIAPAKPEPDRGRVRAMIERCDELLSRSIFSMPVERWLLLATADEFIAWAAEGATEAARFFDTLVSKGWAALGHSDMAGLPDLDDKEISRLLDGERADEFVSRPVLQGSAHETTACSRCLGHALIDDLMKRFSTGLLTRFAAVLTEVALTVVSMKSAEEGHDRDISKKRMNHSGVGVVEAARGRLIHRVRLKADRVDDYRIVAPTEWNFHPQGALAVGLKNLDAADRASLERQAHLLIHAMDPCVSYSLEVTGYA